ncbi:MAG: site-specific DNA-methyltransferase [Nitrososphaerota archaeon]|jgi:site-specific DNA-methyltransferase (adenine-specific)|nr:site-specific DNA-methyltransferase [Nitrososphaerota archaeon]MDG6923731.1 site-specific DNA-methyltransferase [Nitrososphaerota archaeon]
MERLGQKVFPVMVSSPPYNSDVPYSEYVDLKDRETYVDWMGQVAKAAKGVLQDDGSFFLNFGSRPSDPWLGWDVARAFGSHFELQNVIHWVKHISIPKDSQARNGMNGDFSFGNFRPMNSKTYLNQCQEYIFHFTKQGDVPLDKLAIGVPYQHKSNVRRWKVKGKDLRDRGNVWFIRYPNKQTKYQRVLHPAEFPEKLPYLCLKLHGVNSRIVCYDPFMGVGNTALACMNLGVHFVGTEIDPNYVRIANRRIGQRRKALQASSQRKRLAA